MRGMEPVNLLPRDGIVHDHGPILTPAEADEALQALRHELPWQPDEVILFGQRRTTRRLVVWMADPGRAYRYAGVLRSPLPWSARVLALKALIERQCGESFNACLLNCYPSGADGMGWHSDDERELEPEGAIASLSLGVGRDFDLRHRQSRVQVRVHLVHGSLLVMKGATQTHWQHRLPIRRRVHDLRINLTFRTIVPVSGAPAPGDRVR